MARKDDQQPAGFYLQDQRYFTEILNNEEMFMKLKTADEIESEAIREMIVKNNIRGLHTILRRRFKGNVVGICKMYRMTYDDMFSMCMEAFLEAINRFDIDRGFKFTTYYYRSVHLSISKFFERIKINPNDISMDRIVLDGKDGQDITLMEVLKPVDNDHEAMEQLDLAKSILDELQHQVRERDFGIYKDYISGKLTQTELGEIHGVSQVQVSRIVKKIQKKARQIRDSWEAVS